MAEEKTGILQGFKEFVMRGNVIDLAVAVVVGAAFTAVVKAFNDYIIAPVLASVGGARHRRVRLLPAVRRRPVHQRIGRPSSTSVRCSPSSCPS